MSKFFVECPACQRMHEAKTGLFARKTILCSCGRQTDVRTRRMTSCRCPSCGNQIVYDKARGTHAKCPICKTALVTEETMRRVFDMLCPSCSCGLRIDKDEKTYVCPVCDTSIDVQRERVLIEQRKREKIVAIAYKGDEQTILWKHPVTDFQTGAQLTVHEGQEAIFLRNGAALDSFIAGGPYTLETGILPLLSQSMGKVMDGQPFEAEVIFANLATMPNVMWGLSEKIPVVDPDSGIPFELGAHGTFSMRVDNARKLLIKLAATRDILTRDDLFAVQGGLLRPAVIKDIRAHLARILAENAISLFEISRHLSAVAAQLEAIVNQTLASYGVTISDFCVNILLPEDDANYKRLLAQRAERHILPEEERIQQAIADAKRARKTVEAQTEAELELLKARNEAEILRIKAQAKADAYAMQADAEAHEMHAKGYSYQDETARKTGLAAMENAGSGAPVASAAAGAMADAMQIGVQMGVMGDVIRMTRDALSDKPAPQPVPAPVQPAQPAAASIWDCTCGQTGVSGNFCSNCGAKRPEPVKWDCACGQTGVTGNFCSNCGAKRPLPKWDCACGQTGISSNFCSNCGTMRPKETLR